MDPITRRYVWDIILEAKSGRAIVLTTHSMEEADVLADNITIIAKGRLRCFGSALRLKNKFGAGYRISASVTPSLGSATSLDALEGSEASRRAALLKFFDAKLGVAPSDSGRVYTTFTIPRAAEGKLPGFLRELNAQRGVLGLSDFQVSLTTLEQVFLLIAREAEKAAAAADGRFLTISVSMGDGVPLQELRVPWGAEQIIFGGTGEPLDIAWVQDDEGRLLYSHHTWRGERISQAQEGGSAARVIRGGG
jgi:energy-coupling factor transporter ATP-binding protein EcfA2